MPAYLPNLAFQPYVTPDAGGEPIKELSDLGTNLNNIYNTSIAQNDALDEHLAQLKATLSPIDHPLIDAVEQGTRSDLADIKQNGNWENAQMPLRAAARRLLANPAVMVAQQNAQFRQKLDEYSAQAQAQGHHIIWYKDYNNTPSVNPDGTFNKLTMDGVFDKKLDYLSKMQSVFQGLEPNSISLKDSRPERDEASGAIYQVGSGSSKRWVNSDQINNIVANNLDNYIGTDEGQQQMKVLTSLNSDNPRAVDPQVARGIIAQHLRDVGYTHRFSDKSQENSEKLAPGKQQKLTDGTTLVGDTAVQQNQDLDSFIDALDNKNRPGIPTEQKSTGLHGVPITLYHPTAVKGFGKVPDNYKDTYDSLFKNYSDELDTKDPNVINPKIQSYLKSIADGKNTPLVHAFTDTKQIDAANNFVRNGSLDGVPFYDPKTNKQFSLQEIKDNYKNDKGKPIDEEDVAKARVTGNYDQDNPFAELTGNDAFTAPQKLELGGHNFVIGAHPQVTRSPEYVDRYLGNRITKARRTGLPITFNNPQTNDNVKVYSHPDGSYIVQGKTQDGQDIPPTPMSLEQMKKALYLKGYGIAK